MSIVDNFLKLFTVLTIYNVIYNKTRAKHALASIILALLLSLFMPDAFIAVEITEDTYILSYVLSNFIVIFIYSIFMKFFHKETIFDATSWIIICYVIGIIPEFIVTAIFSICKLDRSKIYLTLMLLIAYYLTLFIAYNIRKKAKFNSVKISLLNIKIAIMGMVTFGLIAIVVKFVSTELTITSKMKIFLYVILFCFALTSLVLSIDIVHEMGEKKNLEMQVKYNDILEEYIQRIRATEHEYKNHLNVVYTMLEVGTDDEIKDMVRKYIDNNKSNDKLTKLIYINNTILKAVVYSKLCEAEKKNIKFIHNIKSNLNDSGLKDEEIVVLLTNLLNNAIESAENSEKKEVELTIKEINNNNKVTYSIKVRNTGNNLESLKVSSMVKKGFSSKGTGRGYGLYNIQKIINAHKGNLIVDIIDNNNIEIEVQIRP